MRNAISASSGVFFVATGEAYLNAAHAAARNIRARCPDMAISVATDLVDGVDREVFCSVVRIKAGHRRSKVDVLGKSPFEHTLYLDTDIRIVDDVTEMFRILDRFDIAIAHAHNRYVDRTMQVWREPLPDAFPQLNSGVILFRKSDEVLKLLEDWSKAYRDAGFKKDQVTLRELLWQSDLRFYVLPPEYNIRNSRLVDYWTRDEAKPRILHMARFHEAASDLPKVAKRRVREVAADFSAGLRVLWGGVRKFGLLARRRSDWRH